MDGIEAPAPVGDSGNTNGDGARPLSRSRSNSGVGGGGDHSPSRSRSAKRGYVRADAGTFLSCIARFFFYIAPLHRLVSFA